MQLEQMMGYQPMQMQERQITYFVVGDLESLSASALYSNGDGEGSFKFLKNGLVIPIKGLNISLHDTYNLNSDGNVSNGHSTINLPNRGKVYMPHGLERPSIRRGS